ncbi:methionyl-tRNA formyltransferase [Leptolyngbya sp. 7M]|uniref:methionyl-tRNA formyltransferase n=1 Tax=Leptolyngbya sp. 7M TaxID=2812896 RepID=UPI001B8AB204|nr:methionyl-tRNA formyltransferase [Leptolyngbya sp. 7M]QYO66099.1 methionyl-tRNA formyltransferase [Leptolyngbya sp. 7M]
MKIVFMGTPEAAATSLSRLLADGHEVVGAYTQPDRPSGRGKKLIHSPVKQLAVEAGIPLFQPVKLKTEEALSDFKSLEAEVAVVVAYGRILPAGFLNAFPYGAINLHFSLLPKYRGAAPVNWAIVNGETRTGVTTMKMDAGLDTGDILMQRETHIGHDETSIELMLRLSELGADLLSETLDSIDVIEPRKQDDSAATYAPILHKEDGRIDWEMNADEVARRIRGFQPFPTAFTYFNEKKLTIWKAHEGSSLEDTEQKEPGTIVAVKGGEIAVQCRDSILYIDELQIEGKRRMAAREFLNGHNIKMGLILG